MKPNATQHAIGALKLVTLHLDHPTVISAALVRAASAEAIDHLEAQAPGQAADLGRLYSALVAVTPRCRIVSRLGHSYALSRHR